jgi:hypothetical protein
MPSIAWKAEYQPFHVMLGEIFFMRMVGIFFLVKKVGLHLLLVEGLFVSCTGYWCTKN